jgi:hemolysin III
LSKYLFPVREPFNAFSHLVGAGLTVAATVLLLLKAQGTPANYTISFLIYGVSVFMMFFSSAVYHTINVSFKTEELFRLIDHIMIYIVIAGTYTPICDIVLDGAWRWGMLLGIWLFAVGGIVKKIFWLNAPRWFSTALYLLMGWVAVIIFPQIWESLPHGFSYWIAIGGLFYSVGAVIYAIEKPNWYPPHFEFHELWHLFVLGGAFSHFWAIYRYLPGFG